MESKLEIRIGDLLLVVDIFLFLVKFFLFLVKRFLLLYEALMVGAFEIA
jgi:hypothetical protein